MNWFNEIQGNKAAEVFNDATKVAADYSLRLWKSKWKRRAVLRP